jgi:nicotinamidase-related amidase
MECERRPGMPAVTALLIIDLQVGNFEGADSVHHGEELLSRVERLIERARRANAPVIYVQHCGPKGEIDEPDTPGWQIHPRIAPTPEDPVIRKRHPDAFQETALADELEHRGVRRLVIAGLQTEYCVDTTCRSAYGRGFEVVLVEDAHSTWPTDRLSAEDIIAHHNATLGGWFVKLAKADEVRFDELFRADR